MSRFISIFVKPLLLLALFWVAGFVWFASLVPDTVESPNTATDAIVVVTGGTKRLEAGVELIKTHKAKRLLITGVNHNVGTETLEQAVQEWPKEMRPYIDLGHSARDTRENSLEAKEWVEKNHFKSLRLVTNSYHMMRSRAEFQNAMPDVTIVEHPVFQEEVRSLGWWRSAISGSPVLGEYHKFLLAKLRIFCQDMVRKIT